MRKIILLFFMLFLEESVFSFNIGAKASSLNGCFSSISDDSTSVFWNPAGMAQLLMKEIGVYYVFKDTYTGSAFTFVYPLEEPGHFGIGYYSENTGTSRENVFTAGYAKYLRPDLSFGTSIKAIDREITDGSANALNASVAVYHRPLKNISLSLTMMDIVKIYEKNTDLVNSYKVPAKYRFGLTYYFIMWRERLKVEKYLPVKEKEAAISGENVFLSFDIEKSEFSNDVIIYKGLEFWIGNFIGFRLGPQPELVKYGNIWNCMFAVNNPYIGLSLKLSNFQFDLSYGRVEYPIGISVNYRFGKKIMSAEYSRWEINKRAQQYIMTGDKYYSEGKYAQAMGEWEKALIWLPGNESLQEKINKAEKELERVTNKKIMENYIEQAYLFYEEGKLIESLEKWKSILELEPGNVRAKEYVEKINSKLTEKEKQEYQEKVQQKEKLDMVNYMRKADINFENGKYIEAIKEWERVLEINPKHTEAAENIKNAIKKIEEIVKREIDEGIKLYNQHEYKNSVKHFQNVLYLSKENNIAKEYIAKIKEITSRKIDQKQIEQMYYTAADLYFNGEYQGAIEVLEKLLEIDPLNKNARKLTDKINSIISKIDH